MEDMEVTVRKTVLRTVWTQFVISLTNQEFVLADVTQDS